MISSVALLLAQNGIRAQCIAVDINSAATNATSVTLEAHKVRFANRPLQSVPCKFCSVRLPIRIAMYSLHCQSTYLWMRSSLWLFALYYAMKSTNMYRTSRSIKTSKLEYLLLVVDACISTTSLYHRAGLMCGCHPIRSVDSLPASTQRLDRPPGK